MPTDENRESITEPRRRGGPVSNLALTLRDDDAIVIELPMDWQPKPGARIVVRMARGSAGRATLLVDAPQELQIDRVKR